MQSSVHITNEIAALKAEKAGFEVAIEFYRNKRKIKKYYYSRKNVVIV